MFTQNYEIRIELPRGPYEAGQEYVVAFMLYTSDGLTVPHKTVRTVVRTVGRSPPGKVVIGLQHSRVTNSNKCL